MLRVAQKPAATPAALDTDAVMSLLEAEAGEQTRVERLIHDATRTAEAIACRYLWRRTYEALVEGDGGPELILPVRPVESIASVTFGDDDPIEEGTEPDQFELWAEPGTLYRRSGWLRGEPGWRVLFVAGYWLPSDGEAPGAAAHDVEVEGADLRRAVEEIVRLSWELDGADRTVVSERIGGRAGLATQYDHQIYVPQGAESVLARLRPIVC